MGNDTQEIGGYIELELSEKLEYHQGASRFNTARNALRHFLKNNNIKNILIPNYICGSIVQAIKSEKINISFYNIDKNFLPDLEPGNLHAHLLYVNYFGVCENQSKSVGSMFSNVIFDNSQAFFSKPFEACPTFYSPRKFFGTADGGYMYGQNLNSDALEKDISYERYKSRLIRLESGAQSGYNDYVETESYLENLDILRMSELTQKVLKSVPYSQVLQRRNDNFLYLHKNLGDFNKLKLNINSINGPMAYPFLTDLNDLQTLLVNNHVYVPRYWPEVIGRVNRFSFEYELATKMVALPIDQRYSRNEMDKIIKIINGVLI